MQHSCVCIYAELHYNYITYIYMYNLFVSYVYCSDVLGLFIILFCLCKYSGNMHICLYIYLFLYFGETMSIDFSINNY